MLECLVTDLLVEKIQTIFRGKFTFFSFTKCFPYFLKLDDVRYTLWRTLYFTESLSKTPSIQLFHRNTSGYIGKRFSGISYLIEISWLADSTIGDS